VQAASIVAEPATSTKRLSHIAADFAVASSIVGPPLSIVRSP
jgi:hypothetical protein